MVPQDPGRLLGEGLFQVLRRTPSCLSAVQDLLRWTSGRTEDEDGRRRRLLQVRTEAGPGSFQNHRPALGSLLNLFQTLSSELDALGEALTSQRSKVSGLPSVVPQCLDDAFRVLSVIRASLAFREKRLGDLKQESVQQVRTRLPWRPWVAH